MAGKEVKEEVQIRFEGIMLFLELPDRVEVLIPNSERASVHLDGTQAMPHHAWLTNPGLGEKNPDFRVREALIGSDITIRAGSGSPARASGVNSDLFDMGPLVNMTKSVKSGGRPIPRRNPRLTRNATFLGCRITLVGGRFSTAKRTLPKQETEVEGNYVLHYAKGQRQTAPLLPGIPLWTASAPATGLVASMKLANGAKRQLTLEPGGDYEVSNLDFRTPEEWDPKKRGVRNQVEDGDFRWYYHLFGEPLESWTRVREVYDGILGDLPVPTVELASRAKLSPDEIKSIGTPCQSLRMSFR